MSVRESLGELRVETKVRFVGRATAEHEYRDRLVVDFRRISSRVAARSRPFQLTSLGNGLPSAALETWRYDAAGNVVEQGLYRHEWDFLGRLVRSEVPSADPSAAESDYEEVAYAYGGQMDSLGKTSPHIRQGQSR